METQLPPSTVTLGMPVEIGRIEKELAALWQNAEGVLTRASLINFAVYCEGEAAMHENTQLIAEFMRSHACRAILIAVEPDAAEQKVQSWISAHCHVSRAGAKQVCCEQMTFLLEGESRRLIPNIVFSHLDSDLPLYLWWQAEFPDPVDPQLWTWVDRLIFDSSRWKDPKRSIAQLKEIRAANRGRLALCDLNWTRLIHWRRALNRVFDHPDNLALLPAVERVRITYAPGFRSTAALFAGWIASRMGGEVRSTTPDRLEFGDVCLELREQEGEAISQCVLTSLDGEFDFRRTASGEFIQTSVRATDGRRYDEVLPAREGALLKLLDEELTRGGKRPLYLTALTVGEALL